MPFYNHIFAIETLAIEIQQKVRGLQFFKICNLRTFLDKSSQVCTGNEFVVCFTVAFKLPLLNAPAI